MGVGTNIKMSQTSTQVAFFSIMMCSLLLYNFYSACVVSVRLNEPIYKMNDSLNELAKTNIKVTSEWMDYFVYYLKVTIKVISNNLLSSTKKFHTYP